jgi:hypothetical protein
MTEAPNYRHGGPCCASCDFGCLAIKPHIVGITSIIVNCNKYGPVMPAGVCDDWEED